jgi:hypothetical protein
MPTMSSQNRIIERSGLWGLCRASGHPNPSTNGKEAFGYLTGGNGISKLFGEHRRKDEIRKLKTEQPILAFHFWSANNFWYWGNLSNAKSVCCHSFLIFIVWIVEDEKKIWRLSVFVFPFSDSRKAYNGNAAYQVWLGAVLHLAAVNCSNIALSSFSFFKFL